VHNERRKRSFRDWYVLIGAFDDHVSVTICVICGLQVLHSNYSHLKREMKCLKLGTAP
jgi:hypothetical protein